MPVILETCPQGAAKEDFFSSIGKRIKVGDHIVKVGDAEWMGLEDAVRTGHAVPEGHVVTVNERFELVAKPSGYARTSDNAAQVVWMVRETTTGKMLAHNIMGEIRPDGFTWKLDAGEIEKLLNNGWSLI